MGPYLIPWFIVVYLGAFLGGLSAPFLGNRDLSVWAWKNRKILWKDRKRIFL